MASWRSGLVCIAVALLLFQTLMRASTCEADSTVSASLSTNQFSLEKVAILTIEVQGARSAGITIPEVNNLRYHQRGQSTQMQLINGSFSASISSRYLIQAFEAGKYTIPPITVEIDGKKYQTNALSFTVTQTGSSSSRHTSPGSSTARADSEKDDEVAFLRIERMKDTSFTGEVVPIRIKGYFREGMRVKLTALPALKGDGFVLMPLKEEPQQHTEVVNNKKYLTISWESALSAVKEGKHPVSMEMEATLLFPQRSRSPFGNRFFQDDIFDDFFGSYKSKAVTLASPEKEVAALPLPSLGKPKNFSGAIGNFSLEVQAEPTDIELGEPMTLTMTISGQGNFDRVTAPSFPENKGWKSYSPSSEFLPGGSTYQGKKRFEQAIVVKNGQAAAIPSLSFVYFDPNKKEYITRTSEPIPISVKQVYAGPVPAPKTLPPPKGEKLEMPDTALQAIAGLAPIQLQTGRFSTEIKPLFLRKWYMGLVGICALLLLSSFVIKLRGRHLQKNPQLVKRKEMARQLTQNLRYLEEIKGTDSDGKFLAGCRKAIQEQLGLVWGMEPSAITLDDLKRTLAPDSPLLSIFAAAEQSAYGGLTLSEDEMNRYLEQLQQELGGLQ